MRACGECGSWVPEASATCPKCGNDMAAAVAPPVEAPPVPVGAPPPAPPTPPAPQWAPPAPQWGVPGATAQAPPPPGGWLPAPPPPKKVWPRVIAWIAGIFAVLVVALVVLALVFGDKSAAKLDQYMKGKGVTYQSADGRVTVRFPEQPKLQDFAIPFGNGTTENEHAALLSRHTYEFGFAEIKMPAGVDAAHRMAGLKGSVVGGAKGAEAVLTKSGPTTFRGYQGV